MVAHTTSSSRGTYNLIPHSKKAQAASARVGRVVQEGPAERPENLTAARDLTKGYRVKQYAFLYPLQSHDDFISICWDLEKGSRFTVGGRKPEAPVVDKWMIPDGTTVIIVYGKRYTLQKPYHVKR